MKPGDKVFYVPHNAADLVYLQPIRAGIYVGPDPQSMPKWPKVLIHFGWLSPESESVDSVFATEDEAKARVVALVKSHLRRIRAEAKRLASLDLARVKVRDRTGQIKKRVLAQIAAGGGQ